MEEKAVLRYSPVCPVQWFSRLKVQAICVKLLYYQAVVHDCMADNDQIPA